MYKFAIITGSDDNIPLEEESKQLTDKIHVESLRCLDTMIFKENKY